MSGHDRWNYHQQNDQWPAPWTQRPGPAPAAELFDAIADIITARREPWRQQAACRGIGPTLFFPEQHDMLTGQTALAVCDACEVKSICLQHATRRREQYGVWGGQTVTRRRGGVVS